MKKANTREKEIQLNVCGERGDLVCYENAKGRGDLFWSLIILHRTTPLCSTF
jgi:hypothetical protein